MALPKVKDYRMWVIVINLLPLSIFAQKKGTLRVYSSQPQTTVRIDSSVIQMGNNIYYTTQLPEGTYTIGPIQDNVTGSGTVLPESMRLFPRRNTDMFGRAGFLIHGGNFTTYNSSNGCIVLPPPVRRQVGASGDPELRVIP